jgi:23S rRNA (adenine2503-C2)-methyltransferase
MNKPDLKNFTRSELVEIITGLGEKKYRADQIIDWVYKKKAAGIDEFTNVPEELREKLAQGYSLSPLKVLEKQTSALDGTIKLLFGLEDGEKTESVVLFNKDRSSACISSQVGCGCGCEFCATGGLGLKRDLATSEILGQFLADEQEAGGKLDSIVFMGMGEPFLNWANVKKSIWILSDPKGYNFSQTRITVSTCGIVPIIKEIAESDLKINIAISLITWDETQREEMMPINKQYPLHEVLAAARFFNKKKNRPVMFEYIFFEGKNDTLDDAEMLSKLVANIDCKINLILYNRVDGSEFTQGRKAKAVEFQNLLVAKGIPTYLRREKGSDIDAACGQLAGKASRKKDRERNEDEV